MDQTVSVPEFTGVGGLMWIRLYQLLSSLWCRGIDMDQTVSVPEFTGVGGLIWIRLYQFRVHFGVGGLIWIRLYQFLSSLWCRGIDVDQTVSAPEFTLV